MEWEAQDEGVLAKILVGDGAQDIKVGTPVAVIVEDKADVRPVTLLCKAAGQQTLNLAHTGSKQCFAGALHPACQPGVLQPGSCMACSQAGTRAITNDMHG